MKLKEELNKNNQHLLDRTQIGFQEGLGCELNILRLMESIKTIKEEK